MIVFIETIFKYNLRDLKEEEEKRKFKKKKLHQNKINFNELDDEKY